MGPVGVQAAQRAWYGSGSICSGAPPGHRSSWPHADPSSEEFVSVTEATWTRGWTGELHRMRADELAAISRRTGIAHCFIDNAENEARQLVGGEAATPSNPILPRTLQPRRSQARGVVERRAGEGTRSS